MAVLSANPAFWRDRNVLVTGATGFLGGWLTDALVALEAQVVCVVRDEPGSSRFFLDGIHRKVSIVHGAIEDYRLMERALNEYEVDTVLHLAAQALVPIANRNPLSTFEANVQGTWTILEACRRSPTVNRIVTASSDKAYGEVEGKSYVEGTSALKAEFPYDVSKACADLIAQSYHRTFETPLAITRCGNLYGAGDLNFNRIIPGTIRSILRRERPLLRSNGTMVRDYLFVKDAVRACLALAENLHRKEIQGQAFNFSGEQPRSVLDVVALITRLMQSNLKPKILDIAKAEIQEQALSTGKANKLLKWKPAYRLENSLPETIAWYERFFGKAGVIA
ncbi:MAG: NAD-dependent epimerase/dehydratase family protein [Elusimicrobia bacterium]|nr:NAD-dependent epimerase/dehydratase family protein [Elusimicrobiota bacterium]